MAEMWLAGRRHDTETKENNAGYEIITAETYFSADGEDSRIVLGEMETARGTQYVTWESETRTGQNGVSNTVYFWGHYFNDRHASFADYHRRLLEKYE